MAAEQGQTRLYTVTAQRPTRVFDAANNATEAVEVSYTGPGGIGGRVTVPAHIYTAENVDREIKRDLQPKLEVARLGDN